MVRRKINYKEGDCFSVPLRVGEDYAPTGERGGYARGVVVRMDGRGGVFGCFFGPKVKRIGQVRVDGDLIPDNAVYSTIFGDLGLLEEKWNIIGSIPDWSRDKWPMPQVFLHHDFVDEEIGFLRVYDEDTLDFVGEQKVSLSEIDADIHPRDGDDGYGAVEIVLTRLLALLDEAAKGNPISLPYPSEGQVDPWGDERHLLKKRGWTLDELTGFWNPPPPATA